MKKIVLFLAFAAGLATAVPANAGTVCTNVCVPNGAGVQCTLICN